MPEVPPVPDLVTVILAGGSGTRLWPRSRRRTPKHLLPLADDGRSLLRHAYERAIRLGGEVLIVSAADQGEPVRSEIPELPVDHLLLEPEPRGTGPALAWAATVAARLRPEAVMVSLHADHYLPDADEVTAVLLSAAWWARQVPCLVAVGVRPTRPAVGFGYVGIGADLARPGGLPPGASALAAAAGFEEKPSVERAEVMLRERRHLWNTGLFAWPASLLLDELRTHSPEVAGSVAKAVAGATADPRLWAEVPAGVIERLVLERSRRLGLLPTAMQWSDLGSFWDLQEVAVASGLTDEAGNFIDGDVVLLDSRGSHVDGRSGRLVAVIGAAGLAVVDTPDALLVCPLDRVQEVGNLVRRLQELGRTEVL